MRIAVAFTEFDVDIIDIPQSVLNDIKNIRKKFDKWIYDKDNKLSWDSKTRYFASVRIYLFFG